MGLFGESKLVDGILKGLRRPMWGCGKCARLSVANERMNETAVLFRTLLAKAMVPLVALDTPDYSKAPELALAEQHDAIREAVREVREVLKQCDCDPRSKNKKFFCPVHGLAKRNK